MATIHTPKKFFVSASNDPLPEKTAAPPAEESTSGVVRRPTAPVRRSIDNLELRQTSQRVGEAKVGTLTQKVKKGTEVQSPLRVPMPSKRSEVATESCNKIRQQLRAAGNMKREIKEEIKARTDLLEGIIKAYEEDRKRAYRGQSVGTSGIPAPATPTSPPSPASASVSNEALLRKIEKNERLLKENGRMMSDLKDRIEKQDEREKERERKGIMTYAGVAAGRPVTQVPERATLHSIVVTSKNESDTGEQVMEKLRQVANEDEGWVTVERIRKAKDRKIIMGYKTDEERKRARGRLEKKANLAVEEIQNKDPLLILYGVLKSLSDEDLLKTVRSRNHNVFRDLVPEQARLAVLYRKTARNPHTCHVVLRVCPAVWSRALEIGRLHIDLQPIKVADQSPLVQCSLCLGYGHTRKFCTGTEPKCSHCGGLHLRAACPDYIAGVEPTCCNCQRERLSSTGHSVFSASCPVRMRWDNIARTTTQYQC